jgi:hypothetical protein
MLKWQPYSSTELKMKRIRRIALIVSILLAGGIALYLLLQPNEPRYEGRTLSAWLDDYGVAKWGPWGEENDRPDLHSCTLAISQFGTNTVPFLLKQIFDKDIAIAESLNSTVSSRFSDRFPPANSRRAGMTALSALRRLGKDALVAVPELTRLSEHPNPVKRVIAVYSLSVINPTPEGLLPILLRAARDPDARVRSMAAYTIAVLYPKAAEEAGVYKEWPNAKDVDPARFFLNTPAAQ